MKRLIIALTLLVSTITYAGEFSFQKDFYCANESSGYQIYVEYDQDGNYISKFAGSTTHEIDCKISKKSATCIIPNGRKVKVSLPYERIVKHDEYIAVIFQDKKVEGEISEWECKN